MIQASVEVIPQITISKILVDGVEVPVPNGLSDLLNSSRVWGIPQEVTKIHKHYDRRVEMRNGKVITILSKKEL